MPIITVQFIKDVVATPEQKRQLIEELTNTFCNILGDVVRPFVYTIIQETPQQEWGIAGVPMPDLVYLTGEKHAGVIGRSNELMRGAIAQMATAAATTDVKSANKHADDVWRGAANPAPASANGRGHSAADADAVWRGTANPTASTNGRSHTAADADSVWRSGGSANGTAAEHRRLFERWFEELWNKKNYDIAYELVHPDFTAHGAGGQDIKQGPEGVIGMVKAWHAAMPDGRMTVDDIITEGDLSTIRMTWEATHTGQFGDIPASGNKVSVTSIGIDRVVDGKITEGWGELNMLAMLQQMGAIPSPDVPPESQAATAGADPQERNKQVIQRFHTAMNNKDTQTLHELVHPDFVNHLGSMGDQTGPGPLVDGLRVFYDAMPDLHVTEEYVVAQWDRVATRIRTSGTHQGAYMGIPPTGNSVSFTGIVIYRLNDEGRIVERWQDFDVMTMMQQLGVVPSMS